MNNQGVHPKTSVITSIPALAAALRETCKQTQPLTASRHLFTEPPSPFYQIDAKTPDAEARAAAHLIQEISERLRRLTEAYGEWDKFEPSAYFDLSKAQAAHLVRVVERVSTVYVSFLADVYLPSFQEAELFWFDTFHPVYHATVSNRSDAARNGIRFDGQSRTSDPYLNNLATAGSPATEILDPRYSVEKMIDLWNNLITVAAEARKILAEHIGYLAVNGSQEERARWRSVWNHPPSRGIAADLCPALNTLPTLTLSIEFPLPAHRQPGRKKRLYIQRQKRRTR